MVINYHFHWWIALHGLPALLWGAATTLQITVLSMFFGMAFSLPLAIARRHNRQPWAAIANIWVNLARNTPVIFQLYVAYFGLSAYGFGLSSYQATMLAISFNNVGYLTEILRGGFSAVPWNQYRSARALGMNTFQAYAYVVSPQLISAVYYALMTQGIWAMLNTSLGMIVGLQDLSGTAEHIQSENYTTLETFIIVSIIYYVMAKFLLLLPKLTQSFFHKRGKS